MIFDFLAEARDDLAVVVLADDMVGGVVLGVSMA